MSDNLNKQSLYPRRLDIPAESRSGARAIRDRTLAATLDLKTQVKQAHWNVKIMDLLHLHEMFTALLAAPSSILPEYPLEIVDGKDHVLALSERFATYAKHLREAIGPRDDLGDADTADLYTEISRNIDKRLWFLEAPEQGVV